MTELAHRRKEIAQLTMTWISRGWRYIVDRPLA